MNVYLVVRLEDNHILAVFAHRFDAHDFTVYSGYVGTGTVKIVERTLWYGQPPNRGYNK